MMESSNILGSLNKSTDLLTSVTIQDVMKLVKKPPDNLDSEYWNETACLLWKHLNTTFVNIDDQLLCSTSFYSVLIHIDSKENYLIKIKEVLEHEWVLRQSSKESLDTLLAVSLMYGLFQSSLLTSTQQYRTNEVESVLKASNNLLILMAYEYTRYTFIVFKTIKSYQKVCGTSLQPVIFNEENQKLLLNMVNHNWENSITGIRDLCKEIFELLLSVMDVNLCETVIKEVNGFYWNKAKFFMVAGIFKHKVVHSKDDLRIKLNLNEGLIMSLHKVGLVSAGADMYFEILKKMKSSEEWFDIFLQDILSILTGFSKKAIENFNNYWYLATLKMFPDISNRLLQVLDAIEMDVDYNLYSMLFLMKQGNKLGLLEKNWDISPHQGYEKYIFHGLMHWNTAIRILAFEIICVSNRKLDMTNVECELVFNYLKCNVNSDCTVLRQSMLSSLTSFLTRMHQYYLTKRNDNMDMVINFSSMLEQFIIESLNYNGNYQRKLTTVKIFQIIISTLEIFKSKQKKDDKGSLNRHTKYLNCWLTTQKDVLASLILHLKDPADDIRQIVAQLLLSQSDKINEAMLNDIIHKATESIKSKFFFDIDCALNMFKLIAKILVTNKFSGYIKNVEDLFDWGFQSLMKSYELRKKPVDAIFEGKQIHPYLSLILIVLQVCQNKSYEIKIAHDNSIKIFEILEDISLQFADDDEVGTSTDFAQMNDLVENFIVKSCYGSLNNEEMYDGQTTGLHKLVLNSLWLNVKASCELATFFIIYYKEDINICSRCLKVITDVLETSRHKGAIEAAGFCLGQAIKHLSSVTTSDSAVSQLPYKLLKCKLQEWITEANKMASVTRRGAGMSIMVHRIVSSDMQKGKPLFHFFMKKLLEVCILSPDSLIMDNTKETVDKDLPKAIFIHFLTKIVIDSSLAAHTLYYSTELAEIAFDNLTNGLWPIRNAALQLYGALMPKLIGQKKASGFDVESVATVAVDEFRKHFPKLWDYIKAQIIEHKRNSLEVDSNLVPLLNLLASLGKKYNFSFECDTDIKLLNGLISMLSSPIFIVRRLTAQSIHKMYAYENVYELLINQQFISENQLHGCLLLVQNYCSEIKSNKEHFNQLNRMFNSVLKYGTHSYLNREIYEIMFQGDADQLKTSVMEMYRNKTSPGVYSWLNSKVKIFITNASWVQIHEQIKMILLLNDREMHLETLATRLCTEDNIPHDILLKMVITLLSCKNNYDSFGLWKIMYSISLKVNLDKYIDFQEIMQTVKCINHKNRYLLPLKARSANILGQDKVYSTAMCINMISCKTDEDLKYIAAIANNELAKNINLFDEKTKLKIVTNAVKFLQDEDEDIRNVSVNFLKNIQTTNYALNPIICLQTILQIDFIKTYFNQPQVAINNLKLTLAPPPYIPEDEEDILEEFIDDNNPFANDSINIYEEPNVIRKLVENLLI